MNNQSQQQVDPDKTIESLKELSYSLDQIILKLEGIKNGRETNSIQTS